MIQDRPPTSWVTYEKNNTIKGHGIAFEILNTLSEKFGFVYEVTIPTSNTLINEKGSILNMLIKGVSYNFYFTIMTVWSVSIFFRPIFRHC